MLSREAFEMPIQYLDAAVEASAIVLLRVEFLNCRGHLRRIVSDSASTVPSASRSTAVRTNAANQ